MPKIKLTKEEIKNGWTEETLAAYLEEADERAAAIILPEKKQLPTIESGTKFDPHRW